jgi:di/tricarboxylate transporter
VRSRHGRRLDGRLADHRVITEFLSDAATTALLAPLAAALAQGPGRPPEPYVVTVAVASVTAFLTPMARHGNLVVAALAPLLGA